jgi:AbrB family looped-hinge helix DNA binding protein
MTTISTISTKGQVVIPQDIRNELGLDVGTIVAVIRMDNYVLLRKIDIPDIKKDFEALKLGWTATKKGIKNEKDNLKMINESRGKLSENSYLSNKARAQLKMTSKTPHSRYVDHEEVKRQLRVKRNPRASL